MHPPTAKYFEKKLQKGTYLFKAISFRVLLMQLGEHASVNIQYSVQNVVCTLAEIPVSKLILDVW